ncbi:hypothetical protein SCYAM73S_00833 [Streptomyces cyaneofuscatus]
MAEQHRQHRRPTAEAPDGFAAALRSAVRGEADFGPTARALTTMDASNYRRVPLGVLAPRDADDIAAALTVCQEYGVPVVPRGGGTSIAGQATGTGLVLDLTRHLRSILALDPAARTATVQPGVILDDLRAAAAPHGLTFGPDPSTHSRCTLGGMIGNNSCGAHSVAWGTTADNVRALEVVRYGGEALRLEQGRAVGPHGVRELIGAHLALLRTGYPDLPRRISGYALDALLPEHPGGPDPVRAFCGSEGTLAVVTEATVRLVEAPRARALAVLGYADESAAAEAAPGLLPYRPLTVEGMAADLVREPAGLPRGAAWLFVETGGATPAEARAHAERILRAADAVDGTVVTDPAVQRALWRIREDASGTATRMPDGTEAWPGWEDEVAPVAAEDEPRLGRLAPRLHGPCFCWARRCFPGPWSSSSACGATHRLCRHGGTSACPSPFRRCRSCCWERPCPAPSTRSYRRGCSTVRCPAGPRSPSRWPGRPGSSCPAANARRSPSPAA